MSKDVREAILQPRVRVQSEVVDGFFALSISALNRFTIVRSPCASANALPSSNAAMARAILPLARSAPALRNNFA